MNYLNGTHLLLDLQRSVVYQHWHALIFEAVSLGGLWWDNVKINVDGLNERLHLGCWGA